MTLELDRYSGDILGRARAWANMAEADLRRKVIAAAAARDARVLWDLVEAYIVLHGRSGIDLSRHTLANYERGVRQLLAHWTHENLLRPSRDAGLHYVRALEREGKAPGTVGVRLAAARLLYKALRWARATDEAPFDAVHSPFNPTPPEERREAYTHEEVTKLLAEAGPVDLALVLLGAHAGLRVSEMLSLSWADIDVASGRLRVLHGKGRKARSVVLSAALKSALALLASVDVAATHGPVLRFRSPTRARQRLRRLCERAGVPYRGLHALRHYCGTQLYRIAGDLRIPARHLGHANTSTTEIYAKMDRALVDAAVSRL